MNASCGKLSLVLIDRRHLVCDGMLSEGRCTILENLFGEMIEACVAAVCLEEGKDTSPETYDVAEAAVQYVFNRRFDWVEGLNPLTREGYDDPFVKTATRISAKKLRTDFLGLGLENDVNEFTRRLGRLDQIAA